MPEIETFQPSAPLVCTGCGTQLAARLLTCPGCHRLVHADRLKQLADEAGRAGHPTDALVAWRAALELLPPGSRQYQVVNDRIADLGRQVDALPASARRSPTAAGADPNAGARWGGLAGGLGTLALIAATKGKFLLAGLTKAGTFWSMALTMGVYWTVWGWRFALGLVISIYIHEMGHVAALLRYGVKATSPMFIPGVGAMIRLRQALDDPRQDARVGLAGPVWGLGAAIAAALLGLATGAPIWLAIAKVGAWINLFNLLPFASLDGGRAFHAFSRPQRWLAVAAVGACWWATTDPMAGGVLVLVLLVGVFQAAAGQAPGAERSDRLSLATYAGLVGCLAFLSAIPAPLP